MSRTIPASSTHWLHCARNAPSTANKYEVINWQKSLKYQRNLVGSEQNGVWTVCIQHFCWVVHIIPTKQHPPKLDPYSSELLMHLNIIMSSSELAYFLIIGILYQILGHGTRFLPYGRPWDWHVVPPIQRHDAHPHLASLILGVRTTLGANWPPPR